MRKTVMFERTIASSMVLAMLFFISACATSPNELEVKATAARVWPESPNEPRIRYMRAFSKPADLGISKGFFERIAEFFVGESDAHLVRPMAVVQTQDGTVCVGDPGAKAVQCFDQKRGRYRFIQAAQDQPLPSPVGLAAGVRGEIYVVDSVLAKILVIEPHAELANPLLLNTTLRQPTGVVFDPVAQQLVVVDAAAQQIVMFGLDGKERARIGRRGSGDGEFNYPTHICRDHAGRLYVTDSLNFRIQVLDHDGKFISKFGHNGNALGDMSRPKGVAVDQFDHVYVIDALFHALQVFDQQGVFLLDVGGQGQAAGEFWLPTGLFISDNNTIYIADAHNQRVQVLQYIGDKP